MYNLAAISRQWDSDDYFGKGPGGNGFGFGSAFGTCTNTGVGTGSINGGHNNDDSSDGQTPIYDCDLHRIVANCMPQSEKAVAQVFKVFYETVKPTITVNSPSQNKTYSGANGIPLRAFTFYASVFYVNFYYSLAQNPTPQDWIIARTIFTRGSDPHNFEDSWVNTIDAANVLVKVVAFDFSGCESAPVIFSINIDSTQPKVQNQRP